MHFYIGFHLYRLLRICPSCKCMICKTKRYIKQQSFVDFKLSGLIYAIGPQVRYWNTPKTLYGLLVYNSMVATKCLSRSAFPMRFSHTDTTLQSRLWIFFFSFTEIQWRQVTASEWRLVGALSSRSNYCMSIIIALPECTLTKRLLFQIIKNTLPWRDNIFKQIIIFVVVI